MQPHISAFYNLHASQEESRTHQRLDDMSFQKANSPQIQLRQPRVANPIHLKDVTTHVQSISDNDASSNQGVAKTLTDNSAASKVALEGSAFNMKKVTHGVLREVCCHLDTKDMLNMV